MDFLSLVEKISFPSAKISFVFIIVKYYKVKQKGQKKNFLNFLVFQRTFATVFDCITKVVKKYNTTKFYVYFLINFFYYFSTLR